MVSLLTPNGVQMVQAPEKNCRYEFELERAPNHRSQAFGACELVPNTMYLAKKNRIELEFRRG
jgi:hypothetical protein